MTKIYILSFSDTYTNSAHMHTGTVSTVFTQEDKQSIAQNLFILWDVNEAINFYHP